MYRVIWQVSQGYLGALDTTSLRPFPTSTSSSIFRDIGLVVAAEPVFTRPPVALRAALLALPETHQADPANDLAGYYHAFVNDHDNAVELLNRLSNDSSVTLVEIQPRLENPVIFGGSKLRESAGTKCETLSLSPSPTEDLFAEQGYLAAAPDGVGATFAWELPGGRGQGVTIVDIEQGWNFQHEDLRHKQIGVVHGANVNDDHGTAVLGIYSGDSNGFGITGVSCGAIAAAASAVWDTAGGRWNAAGAIRTVADSLFPGDVILLEMHAPGPNSTAASDETQEGYVPVEYWAVDRAAIRYAVSLGINVVEAAGNGGENLDDQVYGTRFSRDHHDSGAILVGAGMSAYQPVPRSRHSWSNYGSRVDVQGWGDCIVTTGGRGDEECYRDRIDHPEANRCYTETFGGTSGASPMVVGAVASINGALKAAGRPVLTPAEMRQLLVDTGTPQTDSPDYPSSEQIGPLPNLQAALSQLGLL